MSTITWRSYRNEQLTTISDKVTLSAVTLTDRPVLSELPATVPVALALIVSELWRRRARWRRRADGSRQWGVSPVEAGGRDRLFGLAVRLETLRLSAMRQARRLRAHLRAYLRDRLRRT